MKLITVTKDVRVNKTGFQNHSKNGDMKKRKKGVRLVVISESRDRNFI